MRVTIQNVLLWNDIDPNLRLDRDLTFRGASIFYDPDEKAHLLKEYEAIILDTYINALQIKRWKEKTFANRFFVNIEVCGKGSVEIQELYVNSRTENIGVLGQYSFDCEERKHFEFEIPSTDSPLVYFSINAFEPLKIYKCFYSAEVEDDCLRDVYISLATTTFKKEAYIKRNIRTFQNTVLSPDSDAYGHFYVTVIDNGRTLEPSAFNGDRLAVIPNDNVGGAGGFTRGMIEALKLQKKPTHVLLMDDDVLVMGESLLRLYYLLRILRPEYQSYFVSGAMFDYDRRNIQYEDVGYVHKANASFGPVKQILDMRTVPNLLLNEKQSDLEEAYSYAGWWYCCIPVPVIEENGLPLPVFVRGDDVEFSLRNKAKFLTLNGICIWHVGFAGKFNAAMELYQVHRNSLIIQAASDIFPDVDVIARIKPLFWKELTRFAYNNAELLLDAIDDFMKGPAFLEELNGEKSFKEHNAKNEKMVPLAQFPPQFKLDEKNPYEFRHMGLVKKGLYICTINGHLLPNFMLRRKPEVIAYDWFYCADKNFRRRRLAAVNPGERTCYLREIDRKRCFSLITRYQKTMHNYKKNSAVVKMQYREAFKEMTSQGFWQRYLKL